MKTYPINLVLTDCLVILIGAKGEIVHKISDLLAVGAQVRVIAPSAEDEVKYQAALGTIEWLPRSYVRGDLAGATMVIACTNDPWVHQQVWEEGRANNQLVNVMDVLEQCNFHAASLIRRDQLTIAIGTGGAAPALAVRIRERLEQELGEEIGRFLQLCSAIRTPLAKRLPSLDERRRKWYQLVDSDVIPLLKTGQEVSACSRMVEIMGTAPCQGHNGACQVVNGPRCQAECPIVASLLCRSEAIVT
ncbi:MAG: bifunctional precorrin-2 dehydrogenase/sirohydrochlorin ferrochelatase [Chloroflexota bacterium]